MPNNKLFVGGLAWATDDQSLHDAFAPHGFIEEARVITDRETGKSRGFGFVTFKEASEAENAMRLMDGQSLDGRAIRVNEANDRGDRGRKSRPSTPRGDTEVTYHHRGRGDGNGGSRPPRRPKKGGRNDDRW